LPSPRFACAGCSSALFLAAATVIVYAGAIIVTFMFVIMLAQQAHGVRSTARLPLGQSGIVFRARRSCSTCSTGKRTPQPLPKDALAAAEGAGDSPAPHHTPRRPACKRRTLFGHSYRGRARRHAAAHRHDRRHRLASPAARESMNGD
jgi:hypothetical protein